MNSEIKQQIYDHIVDTYLSGDARTFTNETDLLESRVLDSYSSMQLMTFLQTTFNIKMSPEDMNPANLQNVNALADFVRKTQEKEK